MEQTSLLFTNQGEFLGEIGTRAGAFARVILTRQGEELMGDAVSSWQTIGVPLRYEHASPTFEESVSMRHKDFYKAMSQWSHDHSIDVLNVDEDVLVCWQLMARLPLDALQRYAMLRTLRSVDVAERKNWLNALQDADAAVQAEQEKTRAMLAAGIPSQQTRSKSVKGRKTAVLHK